MEIFAGTAGLVAAVTREGGSPTSLSLFSSDDARQTGFDLLKQADFQKLLKDVKRGKFR